MKIKFTATHWLVLGSAVTLFILDLWLENDSESFYFNSFLHELLGFNFPFIITFLLVIFCILVARLRGEEYKAILADKARTFMELYDDLQEMQWRNSVEKAMERFTKNEPYVLAAQLYRYSLKHHPHHVKVQANHVSAYVSEGIELNALVQIIFQIDKKVYKQFIQAKKEMDRNIPDRLLTFIGDLYHEIKEQGHQDRMNDQLAMKYAFLVMGVNILENKLNLDVSFSLDPEIERKLNEHKRTGILRGILLDDEVYTFEHKGISRKRGRLYLTRTTQVHDTPYIFLLTLNPDLLSEAEGYDQLKQLQKKFAKHLQQAFDLSYTINRDQ